MKLQSILLPQKNTCEDEAMYFHRENGCFIFDGYFNLFYLEKHHKYCDMEGLTLELSVKGIRRIVLMHDREEIGVYEIEEALTGDEVDRVHVSGTGGRLSIELPYDKYEKGVFYFKAEVDRESGDFDDISDGLNNRTISVEGHYEGKIAVYRRTKIAVNICTFKRELYVTRNMRSLLAFFNSSDIDGKSYEVADDLTFFIIDNGRTLAENSEFQEVIGQINAKSKDTDWQIITVIPNANTGGTGGFSRGMVEAMEKKVELGMTHLLMMDDDAVFDPDLFVRLYGFLSILKEEYRGITVGGALMREDYRYIQHAAGEWYQKFKVHNDHPLMDLRSYDACTMPWMTGTEMEKSVYGAWWCCCYNMDVVTKENMPLPIFVHYDDIQFGLKQMDRGIVFLNGICVWHQGFELVFPGVKQYYNMRNTLITATLFEPEYMQKYVKLWAVKRYIGLLVSYRYGDCQFVYRGLMDFLKGRQWLMDSDPEVLHKKLMADYKKICPMLYYEQIKDYVKDIPDQLSVEELRSYYTWERFEGSLWKKLTFNGWFLPGDNELQVITPLDSPWDTYRHKRVLLYEPGTKRGMVMFRSGKEFFKGIARIAKMCIAVDVWKMKGGKW